MSLPFIPSVLSHKQLDSSRKFDVGFQFENPVELLDLFSLEPATGECEKRRIAPSHNSLAFSADGIFGRQGVGCGPISFKGMKLLAGYFLRKRFWRPPSDSAAMSGGRLVG